MNSSKPRVPHKARSDVSDVLSLLNLESGVDFLTGSGVFVEWNGALYLAKMLRKRNLNNQVEYFISYDGFKNSYASWVSTRKIYEINPQTKRAFKFINSAFFSKGGIDKPRKCATRVTLKVKQRETQNKKKDNAELLKRGDRHPVQLSFRHTSSFGIKGVYSGVDFLPGSTIFAAYNGGMCLAKMVKKRGRGEFMEYFIQYIGLNKSEEAWVSTALLYEINPQTKRMFRVLGAKK